MIMKRFFSRRQDTLTTKPPVLHNHEHLFCYTSGRWIYNEQEQMRIRYSPFNVDALKQIATTVAGANQCVQMDKISEGLFNKMFLLAFDNDTKLIVKVPCPLVTPRLSTSSEVATMDYARTILDLPVPRVLKYSADSDTSQVGSEYVLMEYVQGTKLYKRMDKFKDEVSCFVNQVIDAECKFARHQFSQIGSLYYKEDVSPELQQRPLYAEGFEGGGYDRFRIGPCADWGFWRGKRRELDVDRGPWPDTLSYFKGIVNIEKQWLSRFATPRKSRDQFRRPSNENAPDAHIRLLDKFLAIISTILPPAELSMPVLWHGLHVTDILVPPEGQPDILALVDWQGTRVRPLFLQASFAPCMRYEGDERIIIPPGMALPTLPPDFEDYSDEEKGFLKGQQRLAAIHKCYEVLVTHHNPIKVASQTYPHVERIISLLLSASRTWYEGLHHLRQALLELQDDWEDIAPGTSFPIKWEPKEVVMHRKVYPKLLKYEVRRKTVAQGLQLEGDGWVMNEQYAEVKQRNDAIMKLWNAKKWGGPYPFQDGGRSWFLS